ncbi:ATP-binding cassette domain-containing protein [Cognatiyoonia sp. IB215446]|uniref:ATP-binding cassette domain-containing protein n=1 Tax=Cognatiyoonia sp. IB215446 TaxID=3097355 RepID=UPI002A0C6455|nr:ATP-binding cassette domain-containing protein [Cognatiyoonia sp. IB215446]MDX8348941.1 ATP-binding cassette domain-containing protein [Cognatiyoonia sp. IB215446]
MPWDNTATVSEAPIVAEGLNHWFGTGEARKQAIFDVSMEVAKGSLTILMGPSGSGKTTVLTLMGCLRNVQHGSVRLLGSELNGASEAHQVQLRQRLGFIFQAHNLHESLTAEQNVLMGLQVHGRGDPTRQRMAAQHMLRLVGLEDRVSYLPGNLSGGQKQRVAVARALVSNPAIVFADEPTAALDKESGANVVRMLKELGHQRGTTTVMVTHDNRILDMADRIVTLEEGRIVSDRKGNG